MRTVSAALILALTLSSCTMFKPESWATQVFSPSSQSINTACDRGIEAGPNAFDFGRIIFSPTVGKLILTTRLSEVHVSCHLIGSFAKTMMDTISTVAKTEVQVQDSSVKRELISMEISLEHDGQELVRLKTSSTDAEDTDKTWFSFRRLNQNQLAALEQTTSFTIVINRGLGEERYAVNPTNLPGL
jgi:hypothetical protein